MKEKVYVTLFIGAFVYLILGTVAVEYDKDVSACVSSFKAEVTEIENREALAYQTPEINGEVTEEAKEAAKDPDFPFTGSLDPILAQRDEILREKGVIRIFPWETQIKGGMRESMTFSIYIPYKPWNLRYS